MALARLTRSYPTSLGTLESVVTALQQIDQLFIDAGLPLIASESTDLSSLTSAVLPANTGGYLFGNTIYRVYRMDDDYAQASPLYLRLSFHAFRNGVVNSPVALICLGAAVYPEPRTPFNTVSSWAANTSYATYNVHSNGVSANSSTSNLSINQAPITSTVFLDKASGRLAVHLLPGLYGFPSLGTKGVTNDTETGLALYVSRVRSADGQVDLDNFLVTCGMNNMGGGSALDSAVYTQTYTSLSLVPSTLSAWQMTQQLMDRRTKAQAVRNDFMNRWQGGVLGSQATPGMPAMQYALWPSPSGLQEYPEVASYWAGGYGTGPMRGSIVTVDNGAEVYDYLYVGSLPLLESLENGPMIGWAFRLGVHNG